MHFEINAVCVLSLVSLVPCLLFAAAEEFEDVQKDVAKLLERRILVGHAVHNDLKVRRQPQ